MQQTHWNSYEPHADPGYTSYNCCDSHRNLWYSQGQRAVHSYSRHGNFKFLNFGGGEFKGSDWCRG